MRLVELEVSRYRSVKDQTGENKIEFEGLDCLVGKNNAGKTNILSAVKFLLDRREKSIDEEMYWQKDPDQTLEVRGFFEVTEDDLARIEDPNKEEKVRDSLLDENGYDGVLGICKREGEDSEFSPDSKLLQFLPDHDRLSMDHVEEFRDERWKLQKESDSYTKTDYRDDLCDEFPEIAELVPDGKLQNKNIWTEKFREYVRSRPDDLDFSLQAGDFESGTKQLVFDRLLPRIVSIPAIKEVESATQRSGEFGDLINLISSEIQDELDEEIHERLDGFQPRDHESIKTVEQQISEHLNSTFDDQSVQFEFPEVSAGRLLRGATIRIQEDHLGDLSTENVGEGVKRTLIFSLLRTLADIREDRLEIVEEDGGDESDDTEDDEATGEPRPLLILYEEAELFLHPTLQKTLLRTFDQLTGSNAQVLFSTHSPLLIQHELLDTINIVSNDNDDGTTVTQFHTVLEEQSEPNQSRLTDLQSVSSYIFADRVLLVEGISDRVVVPKLSRRLDPNWDFDKEGIPIIDTGGKDDVRRFKHFLEDLGIEAYCILDVDAVHDVCHDITSAADVASKIDDLEDAVDSIAGGTEHDIEDLPIAVRNDSWENAFEDLEDLYERLEAGDQTTSDDAELVEKVLSKCEVGTPTELWASDDVEDERVALVERLLEENVLLLSGDLEDYYPHGNGNKREEALAFDPTDESLDELRERFQPLDGHDETDVEVFLQQVFPDEASS